jgi:hypothetical protein
VVKPPLRTKTLGTKVSEEEFAQLEAAAPFGSLSYTEFVEQVEPITLAELQDRFADELAELEADEEEKEAV